MKSFLNLTPRQWLFEIASDIGAALLFGTAIISFARPNHIAPGGFTGLSIMVNYLSNLPLGAVYMMLNVPVLIAGWRKLDHSVLLRSLKTSAIMSFFIDFVLKNIPVYTSNPILAAIYYGVLSGFGLSLVYMRGGSTGGSDFIMLMLKKRFSHLETGRIILLLDAFVILLSAIIYRDIDAALYGILATFASTRLIDSMLYGMGAGKLLLIYTQIGATVASSINERIGRGATLLDAVGSYSRRKIDIVLCGTRKNEVAQVKKIVSELDPSAIVMVLEANEIFGEGFLGISNA